MNPSQVVQESKSKFEAAVTHLSDELKKLRTGRAHPSMLDGVQVEAYGQKMPLIQVASIAVPESQQLQITPFDPSNLQAIAAAIRDNKSLGLNPTDDGRVVRVPIPPLNTERRAQIAKQLHDKLEQCMIALRQVRHDAMNRGDQAKKSKDISEDEHKRFEKQIDDLLNQQRSAAEHLTRQKEQEILTL